MVSPMVTSSIASLDRSASALTILFEVIKTLRDLNLMTTKSGKLLSPIQTLIAILLTRAVDVMEKDSDAKMSSTTFDAANDNKMAQYKNEISKLIPSNNNQNNKPSQDNHTLTKKHERANSNNSTNEDDTKDNEQQGRKRSLSVTSIQDKKDLTFLGMIQQIQNNMTTKEGTTTKSRLKWENWTETSKSTLLMLLSKDYNKTPTKPTARLQDILLLPSGGAVVDLFKDQMAEFDKAMFHSFKIGKLVGHNVDTLIVGPSIFFLPRPTRKGRSSIHRYETQVCQHGHQHR